jgi:hypothetical protein
MNAEMRAFARSNREAHGAQRAKASQTKPVGVRTVPLIVITGATTALNLPTPLKFALPYNKNRKRLIVPNPTLNNFTIWMSFGNNPQAFWIELSPGMIWDESGTSIVTEELWLATSVSHARVGVYDGKEDPQS